jgi:penicillin-binding protein 1C
MKVTAISRWRRRFYVAAGLLCAVKLAFFLWPHPKLRDRVFSSTAVYAEDHKLLRLTLANDQQYRLWTPLEQVSPQLREAVQLYEDRHFSWHYGFNPVSLVRAALSTASGERRIGASTITMQLARRLWHIPSYTVRGKVKQLLRAVQLELQYSKHDIYEAYLNLAPYGGNIEGVGAASLIYFGKPAARLTLPESLALAVIPQNPTVRSRQSKALMEARTQLFEAWVRRHQAAARDRGLMELTLPLRKTDDLPFLAPHFVDEILRTNTTPEVQTGLDPRLQKLLERHLTAYVARRREIGIKNASALLVDTRTLQVKAMVGSADFRDASISGQVSGVTAKRSPGSALKPFVYALGIDQGVIHPDSMLKDVPTAFAAYSPENFDGRFAGPLSAREALIRSRNIPALEVASKLNRPSLYDFMRTAGVGRLKSEDHYGLGIALGNAEVTMEELVMLYAGLGNRGVVRPLRWRVTDGESSDGKNSVRVLSPEASFLVIDMLKDNPRPDHIENDVRVAWKTGTSWGFRDAWSVGLVGPYALAVWVGNFDGEGNPAFVGATAAAPLFFEIIDSLVAADPQLPPLDLTPPPGARRVEVCALTGGLPTPSCHHKKKSWFVPGKSPIAACPVHRTITIDDASGRRVCGVARGVTHSEVYEFWPSDMLRLFAQAGLPRRPVPPAAPGCDDGEDDARAPHITSPLRGVTYTLRPGHEKLEKLALQAVTDGGSSEVFWFVDDRYVGKVHSGLPLFVQLEPGTFQVRAVDDLSRSDARELRVEYAR